MTEAQAAELLTAVHAMSVSLFIIQTVTIIGFINVIMRRR